MEYTKKYIVYELCRIMGSNQKSLKEVEFSGFTSNRFDSPEEAVKALKDDDRRYEPFIFCQIMK